MNIEALMTPNPACCTPDTRIEDVARLMVQHDCGEIPVVEAAGAGALVGVITDRDIVIKCIAEGKDPSACTAAELAQGKVTWVDADTDMVTIVETMGREQIKRLPVMADHKLVGMISEADLAKHLDDRQLSRFVEGVFARP